MTRSPRIAARILRSGGLVAFPTETVYGLGADAFCADAVDRIFHAKGRPADNPLIVHIADVSQLHRVAARITPAAQRAVKHFFPGPLTVIVPRHPDLPHSVTAGLDTVGVRCPDHPVAHAFLKECGVPVAAPSANRSGRPSPTTWQAVSEELNGRVNGILKGGATQIGLESTVIDCTRVCPVILREGAVSFEQLQKILPRIESPATPKNDGLARSPGMNHRHYAPAARVHIITDAVELPPEQASASAFIGLDISGMNRSPGRTCLCADVSDYARSLFRFFRTCEKNGIQHIYCQRVAETGLGRALMDRIRRAADG